MASSAGMGAFLLDGKMIDSSIIVQAQALLTRAAKFGLLHGEVQR